MPWDNTAAPKLHTGLWTQTRFSHCTAGIVFSEHPHSPKGFTRNQSCGPSVGWWSKLAAETLYPGANPFNINHAIKVNSFVQIGIEFYRFIKIL